MRRGFGGFNGNVGAATGTSLTLTGYATDGGRKALASQFSKSGASAGTLANVTGMSVSLAAGKTYAIRGYLRATFDATQGVKIALGASGGLTATAFSMNAWNNFNLASGGADVAVTTLGSSIDTAANGETEATFFLQATIVVNVAGTLSLRFASGTNDFTSTLEVGTTLIVELIG